MIAIIDYGCGNLFSLKSSLDSLGIDNIITNDFEEIKRADKLILPGVGAFGDAIDCLKKNGLDKLIYEEADKGKPILGICLGMQLLFEESYEYGIHKGLGLIKGEIVPISDVVDESYKIPHIGWNALNFTENKSPIFKYLKENDCVHSYFGANCSESTTSIAEYGAPITASVQNKNVFGCQFHPEKSGKVGLSILKAFDEYETEDI